MGPLQTRHHYYFSHLGWYIMMPITNLIGPPLSLTFTASFVGLLAVVKLSTNTPFNCLMLLFIAATTDQLWYAREIMHTLNVSASAHHLIHRYKLYWKRFILTSDVWAVSPVSAPVIMSFAWCRQMMTSSEAERKLSSGLFGKFTINDEVTEGLIYQHCSSWISHSSSLKFKLYIDCVVMH